MYTIISLRNWDVAHYVHAGYQVVRRKNTSTDVLKLPIHFCKGLKMEKNLWNPYWHAVWPGRVISLLRTGWNTIKTPNFADRKEIESVSACCKSDNFSIPGYRRSHPNWIHTSEHNSHGDTLRSLLEVIPRKRPGHILTGVILYENSFVTPPQRTSDTTFVAGDVCKPTEAKHARLPNSQYCEKINGCS
jgi:hypothetical protein